MMRTFLLICLFWVYDCASLIAQAPPAEHRYFGLVADIQLTIEKADAQRLHALAKARDMAKADDIPHALEILADYCREFLKIHHEDPVGKANRGIFLDIQSLLEDLRQTEARLGAVVVSDPDVRELLVKSTLQRMRQQREIIGRELEQARAAVRQVDRMLEFVRDMRKVFDDSIRIDPARVREDIRRAFDVQIQRAAEVLDQVDSRPTGVGVMPLAGRNASVSLPGDVPLELIWIPAGTFTMGCERSETSAGNLSAPPTTVVLTKGFWLGRYEVTQLQWLSIMRRNPARFQGGEGQNRPIENMNLAEVQEFLNQLNLLEQRTGRLPGDYRYVLPRECEWEYACRAGGRHPTAGAAVQDYWYTDNSGQSTHIVGTLKSNHPWGLHDMCGNVWEMCADWYRERLHGGKVTDYLGPAEGTSIVTRGGGWRSSAAHCSPFVRAETFPQDRSPVIGFRIALSSMIP